MPRVPCHTRQQARKSNFHRETYYTRRLVHIHDRGSCIVEGIPPKARNGRHYRVAADSREGERERRRRNTRRLWKLCCHCDWRLTKGATHILLLFLRFRERQEISLLLKYDCCSPLFSVRIDARLNREFGRKYPVDISSSSMPTFAPFHE